MEGWADVTISSLRDRLALERKALFFIPDALKCCNAAGHTPASLAARSHANSSRTSSIRAGRNAIAKVLNIAPVGYQSAIGFLNVANEALELAGRAPLGREDIVACVFRLKDPAEIIRALKLSTDDVAKGCGLSEAIVAAALSRYRLQYCDADAIWRFALAAKMTGSYSDPYLINLTDDPRAFIKTDTRAPMAIKDAGEDGFVYNSSNLKSAPSTGHPWALR